ncbi:MAG: hypothetical protein K2R98_24640 [Gemmataceae bacterium]|nr:hypothetical protein [Gemmataceae bacterium]
MPPLARLVGVFRLTLVCTAAVLLSGAWLVADGKGKADTEPKEKKGPTTCEMKQAIQRYITQKSGKQAFGTSVPKGDPSVWAWETYEASKKQDNKILYAWIAEHLLVADKRYLSSTERTERRKGLGVASKACQCALSRLKDSTLAVKIADTYIIPHLGDASLTHYDYLGAENVIEVAISAYAEAQDSHKFVHGLGLLLESAHNRNTADATRLRLAVFLHREGRHEEALHYLNSIDDNSGVDGAKKLIPQVEKKIRERTKKEAR